MVVHQLNIFLPGYATFQWEIIYYFGCPKEEISLKITLFDQKLTKLGLL